MAQQQLKRAWIALPSEEEILAQMPPGYKHRYDELVDYGEMSGMTLLGGSHPHIGPVFKALSRTIMFGDGKLSRAERETVAAVTAAAQDCHY